MTTKKFANIEEARAKAEEVQGYLSDEDATIGENTNSVWLQNTHEQEILAEFLFEPEVPELVIGDWHRFWNYSGEDLYLAELREQVIGTDANYPYRSKDGCWFAHCGPFDLIDPEEHKKLKHNLEALAADYEKVVAKNGELAANLAEVKIAIIELKEVAHVE